MLTVTAFIIIIKIHYDAIYGCVDSLSEIPILTLSLYDPFTICFDGEFCFSLFVALIFGLIFSRNGIGMKIEKKLGMY